jgi:hypothetical protein
MTWLSASREHGSLSREIAQNVKLPHPELDFKPGTPLERREIRVSEMDKCIRYLAYNWRGVPVSNRFSATAKEKMEKGNLIQDRVRGVLIPNYSRYWVIGWTPELLVRHHVGGVTFTGHPDGFLYEWRTGKITSVFECKSTADYGFIQCCRESLSNPDHYSATYVHQTNTYAGMWNEAVPKNQVNEMTIFVYSVGGKEDKDVGAPYKEFWFAHSAKLFQEDKTRLTGLFHQVEADPEYVPDRPYEQTDWHCTGCSHFDHCYGIRRTLDPAGRSAGPGNVAESQQSVTGRAVPRRPRAAKKSAG